MLEPIKPVAPVAPPRTTNWLPSRKAISGGIGGILAYFVITAAAYAGYPIPLELQASIPAGITWLIYYFVPPSEKDVVRNLDNKIVAMAVVDPASPVTQAGVTAAVRALPPT